MEYSARAIFRPDPRLHGGSYARRVMALSGAIEQMLRPRLGAPHRYLSTVELGGWLPELLEELGEPTAFHPSPRRAVFLFAGGAGTGSQTHYDLSDNFAAVLEGRKRVWLMPPGDFRALRPWPALFRPCHFSRLRDGLPGVPLWECVLGPGDMLYIPAHWWHYVENPRPTLGVTFSHDNHSWRARLRWRHLRVLASSQLHGALGRAPRLESAVGRLLGRLAWRIGGLVPSLPRPPSRG